MTMFCNVPKKSWETIAVFSCEKKKTNSFVPHLFDRVKSLRKDRILEKNKK